MRPHAEVFAAILQRRHWSHDAIKRAALAVREARSDDYYVLARLALQAAVRTRSDLLELLNDAPTSQPTKSAPAVPIVAALP